MARCPVVGDLRRLRASADRCRDRHTPARRRSRSPPHTPAPRRRCSTGGSPPGHTNALKEALTSHPDQPLCLVGNLPAGVSGCTVAVEAADVRAHVHTDDVALLQHPVARDAVDDLVVDGDAHAGRDSRCSRGTTAWRPAKDKLIHQPCRFVGLLRRALPFPLPKHGLPR